MPYVFLARGLQINHEIHLAYTQFYLENSMVVNCDTDKKNKEK